MENNNKIFDDFFKESKLINKVEIRVPDYVKFISDWKEFIYPKGHVIFDKTICGCGFTEYCLKNQYPTILCSPRKVLLENKLKQHLKDGDRNIYYFKNEKEESVLFDNEVGIDKGDVQKMDIVSEEVDKEIKAEYIKKLKELLRNWLEIGCEGVPKILVTYDSLKHVMNALGNDLCNYKVVVDEFQSIFTDSSFKSDVELNFVELLKTKPSLDVLYLSATPMLDRYLGIIEYFKDLPFYKLIWNSNRVDSIVIDRKFTPSIIQTCSEMINQYKSGVFIERIGPDNKLHQSREIVFFVNSVKTIKDIIKKSNLTPQECNIICSQTAYNSRKIKNIGKGFDYGKIPTKGEINKMFTFCTKTAYLGADFYSTNAYTVICSNINIDTLSIDISLDLPQIVGRQRDESNIFRKEVLLLYTGRTKKVSDITIDQFIEKETNKERSTKIILEGYGKLNPIEKLENSKMYKIAIKSAGYSNNYVGIDSNTGYAKYNYLAKVSSLRSYEISRPEYQERVLIKRNEDTNVDMSISDDSPIDDSVRKFINDFLIEFRKDNNFERRMKLYCELLENYGELYKQLSREFDIAIPVTFKGYVSTIGISRIKTLKYRESDISKEVTTYLGEDDIREKILSNFLVGYKYTKSFIKETLCNIYKELGLSKVGKATDLEKYYNLKRCLLSENGKRNEGFEILSKKEE